MDNTHLTGTKENWDNIQGYEMYVGRWSRALSLDFVHWLNACAALKWMEIGCGTGALTQAIAETYDPSSLLALDKSEAYLTKARENGKLSKVSFLRVDLDSFLPEGEFDNITSGLVLNFLPHTEKTLRSLMSNLRNGGQLSAFVWDYGGHYQPMRHFWDAAKEVSAVAKDFDTGIKFEICRKEKLISLFESLGLTHVEFTNLERIAMFQNFDDYWLPIASAQGSVTEFISILTEKEKDNLKETIRRRLPIALNGEIKLIINALAVKGVKK
jgi:SAM-dependent methyltransferase